MDNITTGFKAPATSDCVFEDISTGGFFWAGGILHRKLDASSAIEIGIGRISKNWYPKAAITRESHDLVLNILEADNAKP
jgi:hypothetical protein